METNNKKEHCLEIRKAVKSARRCTINTKRVNTDAATVARTFNVYNAI
jgi:hypothetical protein